VGSASSTVRDRLVAALPAAKVIRVVSLGWN